MKSLPPSAAQTGRTVFPYPAFMKELSRSEAGAVASCVGIR
jgi:hypothetical protein